MNEQHQALNKFSEQIRFSLEQYKPHGYKAGEFSNVIIAGLGGSGIGGQIAKALVSKEFQLPVECVADYHLPTYAGKHTLVIACSYSGNTEETLSVFDETVKLGCRMIVLTSGGKLKELAEQNSLPLYVIREGFQPRMALGFSLTYLLLVLSELNGKSLKEELSETADAVADVEVYQKEAMQIFESIKSKTKTKFVVLTDGPMAPVGVRFSQQINENAKHECFCHVLPEMNHNVIESYYGKLDSVYFFIDSLAHERITSRFEFLTSLLEVEYNKVVTIPMEEFNVRSLYEVIFVLDWLSLYVADHRSVDSLNVPNIKSLKEFLDQVS